MFDQWYNPPGYCRAVPGSNSTLAESADNNSIGGPLTGDRVMKEINTLSLLTYIYPSKTSFYKCESFNNS